MRLALLFLVPLALCSIAFQMDGQTVKGVVRDMANGAPIADASVVLLDSRGRVQRGTLSDPDGSYVLVAPGKGKFKIRVGAAGYITKDSPDLELAENAEEQIDVVLVSDDPDAGPPGFNARMQRDEGEFLTRADIDASGTNVFTELLRYTSGVTIVPLPTRVAGDSLSEEGRSHLDPASAYTVRLKATRTPTGARQRLEATDDCVPVLWVDGLWWGPIDGASDRGPNGKLFPDEIEAVELYNHPSILPALFDSGADAQNCGVVVVWTRGLVKRQ
jgi:hypothetical protein